MFEEIRIDGHLIARIDPQRALLEIKGKRGKHLVDLKPYIEPPTRSNTDEGEAKGTPSS